MSNNRLTACAICEFALEQPAEHDFEYDTYTYLCPCCGRFKCTEESDDILPRLSLTDRVRLAGAVREQSDRAKCDRSVDTPLLRSDNIGLYLASAPAPFDVTTKVRKLLSAVARRSTTPGEHLDFADDTSHALAYAANFEEWDYLTEYAANQGWIEKERVGRAHEIQLRLTPLGWEETQHRPRMESSQGFVAMWFDPSMTDAFNDGLKAAIEFDCHYRCRRIDVVEYNDDVVDAIMAEIREARFVVCDLTGHRNGVYFEAGFAMGLGIPTIWTCREDHAGNTHFDAEHFNQIRWTTPSELRKKLATRIRATIGLGPLLADQLQ